MTSSNGTIFRVTGPLCGQFTGSGEFPAQRPVTRSFDVFFDLRLNKRLSKQPHKTSCINCHEFFATLELVGQRKPWFGRDIVKTTRTLVLHHNIIGYIPNSELMNSNANSFSSMYTFLIKYMLVETNADKKQKCAEGLRHCRMHTTYSMIFNLRAVIASKDLTRPFFRIVLCLRKISRRNMTCLYWG